jgi:hypothetical protein
MGQLPGLQLHHTQFMEWGNYLDYSYITPSLWNGATTWITVTSHPVYGMDAGWALA